MIKCKMTDDTPQAMAEGLSECGFAKFPHLPRKGDMVEWLIDGKRHCGFVDNVCMESGTKNIEVFVYHVSLDE